MKVILKEYVYKHGVAGDVVTVADGFARNFLLPQGLAVKATSGALRQNQQLIAQAVKRREELRDLEDEVAHQIHGVELVFGMKAGKNNKLYGSVTTMDIAAALMEKTGVDINRRRISERSLRELGVHEVPVRLSASVHPVLQITILREEEVGPYLAGEQVATLADLYEEVEEVEADVVEVADAGEAVAEVAEEVVAAVEEAAEETAEPVDDAEVSA